ncbi:arginine deiminase [Helcococcus ovis]|uniref:Arginine deiminase n=1 Tax=Helcococcus ovis TaxID=72026 RepID=A0A4R9C359_9FIRM|nr:arginine deiminase [Helcococcus ovis]TFF65566.1 arginine deiminase [Helcococcus ovis]TFF67670.1 arginine deiminase [Helcococcus ovis]
MRPIQVTSEIKKLKKVLVHRPGNELLNLTPSTLEELLFDDIPDLKMAQEEHDRFTEIMRNNGVEVVYLENLMTETLDVNEGLREIFLEQYLSETGVKDKEILVKAKEYLQAIEDTKEFVEKTMAGLTLKELGLFKETDLEEMVLGKSYLAINPMPNLYFTRDPFASVGNGAVINRMYSVTRNRETIYCDYIFKNHPEYKGKVSDLFGRHNEFHIEGGDVLNVSETTLLVGISQRTQFDAIKVLANNLFFGELENKIEKIYALSINENRAFMHLDTVFTQIDVDAFTYHPAIIKEMEVKILSKDKEKNELRIETATGKLDKILANCLEIEKVRLIPCGGGDPIAAEREQWNDGSNTLTLSPGKVIVYKRNIVTNEILKKEGIEVLELDASNLTVGRGGPRCMSMPLVREN